MVYGNTALPRVLCCLAFIIAVGSVFLPVNPHAAAAGKSAANSLHHFPCLSIQSISCLITCVQTHTQALGLHMLARVLFKFTFTMWGEQDILSHCSAMTMLTSTFGTICAFITNNRLRKLQHNPPLWLGWATGYFLMTVLQFIS